MLPRGFATSSSEPWKAHIATEPRPQPAVAHAGRPSPPMGMAAATCVPPYFATYSHVLKAPQDSPVT
jgi:hypothetical protein